MWLSNERTFGPLVVSVGVAAVVVGVVVTYGWLGWFGHLPGDIHIERTNLRVYLPIGSMLLVSILLSAVSYILRRLF